ncbi:hypothetical protein BH23ACT5_BH23ACT5_08260 [soil metagenome]
MTATVGEYLAAYSSTAAYERVSLASAACRSEPSEVFFSPSLKAQAAAKRICSTCPVRWECLFYAIDTRQQFGVWGGLSAEERLLLRRQVAREMAS